MLATIVYAINPNQETPVEGFTSFSPSPEAALKRKAVLESAIEGEGYKHWVGEWRREFIERCKKNNWSIHVKTALID